MEPCTECRNSKQCSPAKHHFDECVERVTSAESEGGAKEDCVEECTSPLDLLLHALLGSLLTRRHSLPPRPLCHPVRRSQALVRPQINQASLHDGAVSPFDSGQNQWLLRIQLKRFLAAPAWLL